jgi:hypothetical protein
MIKEQYSDRKRENTVLKWTKTEVQTQNCPVQKGKENETEL